MPKKTERILIRENNIFSPWKKEDYYPSHGTCENCKTEQQVWILKGVTKDVALLELICPECGCRGFDYYEL